MKNISASQYPAAPGLFLVFLEFFLVDMPFPGMLYCAREERIHSTASYSLSAAHNAEESMPGSHDNILRFILSPSSGSTPA